MHCRKCRGEPATGHAVRHPERERARMVGVRHAPSAHTRRGRASCCHGDVREGGDTERDAPPTEHGQPRTIITAPRYRGTGSAPWARHDRSRSGGWTPHVQGPRKRRIPEPATQGTPQPSSCRAARARRRKHRPRRATASEILAHRKSWYFGDKHHTELICARAGISWPLPVHSTSSRTSKHAIPICHERTFHYDNESICSFHFYNIHQ